MTERRRLPPALLFRYGLVPRSLGQHARRGEVARDDGVRRVIGESADRPSWVVPGVLREVRRADHEEVVHVPDLAVLVHHRSTRVRTHDGSTLDVRRLIWNDTVVGDRPARVLNLPAHRRRDARQRRLRDVLHHHPLIIGPVEGEAQQRVAPRVAVGRIEIEVVLPVGRRLALHAEVDDPVVVLLDRLLPRASPARGAGWKGTAAENRPGPGLATGDIATAEEPQIRVVEVVTIELVDAKAVGARTHEAVDDAVRVPDGRARAAGLIGVVLTDDAAPGLRIVWLADLGEQHQPHVLQRPGAEDDEVGRLLLLHAVGIVVGDAGRNAILVVDAEGIGVLADLDPSALQRVRDDGDDGACLGADVTAEALAEATVVTRSECHPVGIFIALGTVAARQGEGAISQLLAGLAKEGGAISDLIRRLRVLATRAFEWVSPLLDLAAEVACLAGYPEHLLVLIVVRLQLVVGDAPVLDGGVLGKEVRAVALFEVRAILEKVGQEAPGDSVPVDHRASDTIAGQERAVLSHRQRRLVVTVAKGNRVTREVLEQFALDGVPPLIKVILQEVRIGITERATLQCDHLQRGVLAQLVGDRTTNQPESDKDDVDLWQLGHG